MKIRKALQTDLDDVLAVERAAFGGDEEAALVRDLLDDASAQPDLSLLAFQEARAVGHILFTRARITEAPDRSAAILAPLAVIPEAQQKGIGGALIDYGLQLLAALGVDLVFVLGYPDYYTRFGFEPAGRLGFAAPYPIPEKNAEAWMVRALAPGVIGKCAGTVRCAEKMDRPEYWRE